MNGMLYVYKSMLNKIQNERRNTIIFILFIVMTGALFISRALLSASMIVFILVSFLHSNSKKQVYDFFSTPLLWGMSVLFLIPFISGLWSSDKKECLYMFRIKLPLLFLPLAFSSPFSFTKKQWEWLGYIFISLITGGTLWCMYHYLQDTAVIHEGYLKAKTFFTPLENDRVRFSWMVSVGALLAGWLAFSKQKDGKTTSLVLIAVAGWLAVFLHILAVRTGLFSFYSMLFMTAAWMIIKNRKKGYSVILLILLIAMPVTAYFTLPTFQNRIKYINYDYGYFSKANYLPGGNDALRVISIKGGWNIMKENPVTGTGFGDVLRETRQWYASHYPEMREEDKIYPGSEWMMYGAGSGIPGFVLFTVVMLIPFFVQVKDKILWWLLNATAAFSFLFDIGLEVQFGVFTWSFIVLWWWKWLKQ